MSNSIGRGLGMEKKIEAAYIKGDSVSSCNLDKHTLVEKGSIVAVRNGH
jgi:hypothetical protein